LLVVVRKAWPGEMLGTPLAQLTLGQLFLGLIQVGIGFAVGSFLVMMLVNIPKKEERNAEWAGWWIMTTLTLAFVVALPFIYEGSPKRNRMMDFVSGAILLVLGWVAS